jgi:hypothetical protein
MAENIDWKKLGLGVKDLLVGVVTVAGGATGGAAGAQGGQQAGKGLDKILNMAGVSEEETAPKKNETPALVAMPPSSAEQERIAARHVLAGSGWTAEEIEILLLGKTPKSRALIGVIGEGSRVPTAVGIKLPTDKEVTS